MKKRTRPPMWIAVALPGACILAAIVAMGQTRPPTLRATQPKRAAADTPVQTQSAGQPSLTVDRKALAYYVSSVRGDLFSPPQPPAPKVEAPKVIDTPLPAAPVEFNPFADYAYTGTVASGERTVALVENAKTKEGLYLSVGDSFLGGTVKEVTDRMVTVDIAGKTKALAKTDDFKLVSLDKSAPYLTAQPQQPGQGGPPWMRGRGMGPGGMGPGGTGPGGMMPGGFGGNGGDRQQRMQRWMQRMSPEQQQRVQERMLNRQFER